MKGKGKKVVYRLSPRLLETTYQVTLETGLTVGMGAKKIKISDSAKQLLCQVASSVMKQALEKLFTLISCE